MMIDFGFKMTIMILLGLLMGASRADVSPNTQTDFCISLELFKRNVRAWILTKG